MLDEVALKLVHRDADGRTNGMIVVDNVPSKRRRTAPDINIMNTVRDLAVDTMSVPDARFRLPRDPQAVVVQDSSGEEWEIMD